MTTYGILVVEPTWHDHDTATLDKSAYLRWGKQLQPGTRALIYVKAPISAIVAEAEIAGEMIETETAPPDPAFNPAIDANLRSQQVMRDVTTPERQPDPITGEQQFGKAYRIPLKIMRAKAVTPQITETMIQQRLTRAFSTFDESWIPLDEADYHKLVAAWEGTAR
jgi:hypothetical protein